MHTSQQMSIIDQLFDALDAKEQSKARYKISSAIDRAKRAATKKVKAAQSRNA